MWVLDAMWPLNRVSYLLTTCFLPLKVELCFFCYWLAFSFFLIFLLSPWAWSCTQMVSHQWARMSNPSFGFFTCHHFVIAFLTRNYNEQHPQHVCIRCRASPWSWASGVHDAHFAWTNASLALWLALWKLKHTDMSHKDIHFRKPGWCPTESYTDMNAFSAQWH